MKKTFFALLLVLASVVVAQAQNLTRTAWSTMLPGDEEVEMVLNFDNDGECYMILTKESLEDEGETAMTIRISLSIPGIFNKEGRDITMSFNKRKAEINIDYELLNTDAKTKALVDRMMRPELKKMEPQLKKELLDEIPAIDDLRVISLSREKMVVRTSSGDRLTFYPTAKG